MAIGEKVRQQDLPQGDIRLSVTPPCDLLRGEEHEGVVHEACQWKG